MSIIWNRKNAIRFTICCIIAYLAVISFDNIVIKPRSTLSPGNDAYNEEIVVRDMAQIYGSQTTNLNQSEDSIFLSEKIQRCMEKVKKNYTLMNGVFIDKKTPLSNLQPDFDFRHNPLHTCLQNVTYIEELVDNRGNMRVINKTVTISRDIYLITIVHTAPSHFEHRSSIRETWGAVRQHFGLQIRTLFVLGLVGKDQVMQGKIDAESNMYGDIIQSNFEDAYRNLTYKFAMGMKWITYYCPHASFILKMDDDIYVDVFQVLRMVTEFSLKYGSFWAQNIDKLKPEPDKVFPYNYSQPMFYEWEKFKYIILGSDFKGKLNDWMRTINTSTTTSDLEGGDDDCITKPNMFNDPKLYREYRDIFGSVPRIRDLMFCAGMPNSEILRNTSWKWYVPESDYQGAFYEPYCSGWGLIMTPPLAFKLYKAYFTQRYFFIDDAHITGKLARIAGAFMINIYYKMSGTQALLDRWTGENVNKTEPESSMTVPWIMQSRIKYMFVYNSGNRGKMRKYWEKTLKEYDMAFK